MAVDIGKAAIREAQYTAKVVFILILSKRLSNKALRTMKQMGWPWPFLYHFADWSCPGHSSSSYFVLSGVLQTCSDCRHICQGCLQLTANNFSQMKWCRLILKDLTFIHQQAKELTTAHSFLGPNLHREGGWSSSSPCCPRLHHEPMRRPWGTFRILLHLVWVKDIVTWNNKLFLMDHQIHVLDWYKQAVMWGLDKFWYFLWL